MKHLVTIILIVVSTSILYAQPGSTTSYNIVNEFIKAPNFPVGNIDPKQIFFPPTIRLSKQDYYNEHIIDSVCETVDLYVASAIKKSCTYIYLTIKSGLLRSKTFYFDLTPVIEAIKKNMRREV